MGHLLTPIINARPRLMKSLGGFQRKRCRPRYRLIRRATTHRIVEVMNRRDGCALEAQHELSNKEIEMSEATALGTHRNELSSDIEALKSDMASLRKDFSGIASNLGQQAKERAAAVKETVQDSVQTSISSAESCVQRRPLTSVVVAFGVGVIVSKLLKR